MFIFFGPVQYPYEIPNLGVNIHNCHPDGPVCQGDSKTKPEPDIPSHKIQMPLLVTSPKSSWPLLEVDFPKKIMLL